MKGISLITRVVVLLVVGIVFWWIEGPFYDFVKFVRIDLLKVEVHAGVRNTWIGMSSSLRVKKVVLTGVVFRLTLTSDIVVVILTRIRRRRIHWLVVIVYFLMIWTKATKVTGLVRGCSPSKIGVFMVVVAVPLAMPFPPNGVVMKVFHVGLITFFKRSGPPLKIWLCLLSPMSIPVHWLSRWSLTEALLLVEIARTPTPWCPMRETVIAEIQVYGWRFPPFHSRILRQHLVGPVDEDKSLTRGFLFFWCTVFVNNDVRMMRLGHLSKRRLEGILVGVVSTIIRIDFQNLKGVGFVTSIWIPRYRIVSLSKEQWWQDRWSSTDPAIDRWPRASVRARNLWSKTKD